MMKSAMSEPVAITIDQPDGNKHQNSLTLNNSCNLHVDDAHVSTMSQDGKIFGSPKRTRSMKIKSDLQSMCDLMKGKDVTLK